MEIRPMADMQAAIARQEDVKREEQRDLKAKEASKRRRDELSRVSQENKDQSVAETHEIEDPHTLDPHSGVTRTTVTSMPRRQPNPQSQQEPPAYFKDPNLGSKIDISS